MADPDATLLQFTAGSGEGNNSTVMSAAGGVKEPNGSSVREGPAGDTKASGHAYVDPFAGVPVKGATPVVPEAIALREWEAKHERDLEEAANSEENEKREARRKAESELTKFKEDREATIKKRLQTNRVDEKNAQKAREEELMPGTNPWERVCSLIDTNARSGEDSRDTSRMRMLLLQLKGGPAVKA